MSKCSTRGKFSGFRASKSEQNAKFSCNKQRQRERDRDGLGNRKSDARARWLFINYWVLTQLAAAV